MWYGVKQSIYYVYIKNERLIYICMYRFRCMNYDKIQDVCRIDLDDFKGTCYPFYYID